MICRKHFISHEQLWSELLNRLNSHLFVSVCSNRNTFSASTEFLLHYSTTKRLADKRKRTLWVHLFRRIALHPTRPKQAAASSGVSPVHIYPNQRQKQTTTRLLEVKSLYESWHFVEAKHNMRRTRRQKTV